MISDFCLYLYVVRMYDAQVARLWTTDAWAEKYYSFSPYNYVFGNSIIYIDPIGSYILASLKEKSKNET